MLVPENNINKKTIALMLLFFSILSLFSQNSDLKQKQMSMLNEQIKARGIVDTEVLNAMQNVQRHLFVPDEFIAKAYDDNPLPIGYGQTISQPYIVAYMTVCLQLKKTDRVLEIGTGSGYQAAILAEICQEVFTIEIIEPLAIKAQEVLSGLNYKNIHLITGDGYMGLPDEAPFDAIIVTCAPNNIPQPLIDQLKEGGRIAIPFGATFNQQLKVFVKKEGQLKEKKTLPVRFVPMVDEKGDIY